MQHERYVGYEIKALSNLSCADGFGGLPTIPRAC